MTGRPVIGNWTKHPSVDDTMWMQEPDTGHVIYRPMTVDEEWRHQYCNRASVHPTIKSVLITFSCISLVLCALWVARQHHKHIEKYGFAIEFGMKQEGPDGRTRKFG